jgi:tetratricopeptide (TPR) repeat protein
MENVHYNKIELVFRNSNSPDELFDAFGEALKHNITDLELYKILFGNPTLSFDEIRMFAGKLFKVLSENRFELCMWIAKISENKDYDLLSIEFAIDYYVKAIELSPASFEPLVELIKLYNTELELSYNKKIIELVDMYIPAINYKSKVYFALADLYKKTNNLNVASKYLALANISAERESSKS